MIGKILNERYRIETELGQGGMGVVYRAYDVLLDREVAVKVLSEASKTRLGTDGRARLLHEAKAAGRLSHPNIVAIFDAGEAAGLPFIVMELIKGESLYERRPQSVQELVSIARQVCAGLQHAHSHGVVHRDLKPENIIVGTDGSAKLTDFGLARSVSSRLTADGLIVGTVLYLAPEAALRQAIDGRADLYSLGVILYELASGCLPFQADDPLAVISQHLYSPVIPPRAHRDDIPYALNELILRLLEKQPEARPATALEVQQLLENLGAGDRPAQEAFPKEMAASTLMLERIVRGRLVGRERELAEMRAIWRKAVSGEGHVLVVSGESGIGKTRVVRELIAQAAISGGRVLSGSCYAEGGMPYTPFPQLIYESFQSGWVGQDLPRQDLPDFVFTDLAAIAPELRLLFPDLAPGDPRGPVSEQQRVFESLLAWTNALAANAPLILFIDDVHWADSSTLFTLRHMARRTHNQPVLLVLAYREVEVSGDSPLQSVLNDLNRERLSTRVKLTRLDRAQTHAMLITMLTPHGEIDDSLVEAIYRETEGNPFFIEEVTKALIEEGKLCFEDICWVAQNADDIQIPQSVRMTIQTRLSRLPAPSQEVMRLAAIFGRQFDFEALKAASELDEETLIDALETAEGAQIIQEVTHGRAARPTFSFAHALIPTTLREEMSSLRRQRLHRRAAKAIETLYPGEESRLDALAYHYEQAGDAQQAKAYYTRAGDRALKIYANQEAERYYREALDLEPEPQEQAHLSAGLGEALFRQSRYQQAAGQWQEAVRLYKSAGDHNEMARLYARLGRAAWYMGDVPGSLAVCREGLKAVEGMRVQADQEETPGMAALLHETARAYRFNDMLDEALPLCEQALAMAERLDMVEVQADTLATLGILPTLPLEIRRKNLAKAVDLAEKAGLFSIAARAHVNLGTHMMDSLEFAGGRRHYLRAIELARRMGMAAWEHGFLGNHAEVSLFTGDFAVVEDALSTMSEIRSRMPDPEGALFFAEMLAVKLYRYRGEYDKAFDYLQRCLKAQCVPDDVRHSVHFLLSYCELLLDMGRIEEAAEAASEAIEKAEPELPRSYIEAMLLFSVALAKQGRHDEARQWCDKAREMILSREDSLWDMTELNTIKGIVAVEAEEWETAYTEFESAANVFSAGEIKWSHAFILRNWGEALYTRQADGDRERGRELLLEARSLYQEMDLPVFIAKIDQLLNQPDIIT